MRFKTPYTIHIKMILSHLSILISTFSLSQFQEEKAFSRLLSACVTTDGLVDYRSLKEQRELLDDYFSYLENNQLRLTADSASAKSYWINYYNTSTLRIVLSRYPLKSMRDIPTANLGYETIWEVPLHKINGRTYSLNQVERELLIDRFQDPRIHFALVCGAQSCPPLRRELYDPGKLDEQLDDQARIFLSNPKWNQITGTTITLSPIFKWYRADFLMSGQPLHKVLSSYTGRPFKSAVFEYSEYDWRLNAAGE
jgi:hypothetical protein